MHLAASNQAALSQNQIGLSKLPAPFTSIFRSIAIACLLVVAACRPGAAPKHSVYEITGSSAERVAGVSAIITKHRALPTSIVDAHFIEEQIGDGNLGPSDFQTFYSLEVSPQNLSQWTQILTPLGKTPSYVPQPSPASNWWVSPSAFPSLQFYKSDGLTGRANGWIGVSQQTGHIYIFTFTM